MPSVRPASCLPLVSRPPGEVVGTSEYTGTLSSCEVLLEEGYFATYTSRRFPKALSVCLVATML